MASSNLDQSTYVTMATSTQTAPLPQDYRLDISLRAEDSPSFPASDSDSRSATPDSFHRNFGYSESDYDFDRYSASLVPSYQSAGQGSARHYRAQLKRNDIAPKSFINATAFSYLVFPFKVSDLSQQVNQRYGPFSKYSCVDRQSNERLIIGF